MLKITYLCSLLFIVIYSINLIMLNNTKCPLKIKRYYNIALIFTILRGIALIITSVIENQRIVYIIKPLIVIDFITIPLLSLATLYIFFRDENRSFNYNYVFMIVITGVYVATILIYKLKITIDNNYGFIVNFKEYLTPSLIYLIMIATLAVISLMYMDKPHGNKNGIKMLMISLMITIVEFIVFLDGIKFFPYPLLGQVLVLITTYNAINTFRVNSR